jgi:geranylgeranyl diphosphate synthase type II
MLIPSSRILDKVNEYLAHMPYAREPMNLYAPVQYVLSMGGKRLRPVLMLLTYNLYKEDLDAILEPAAGIEVYHNFTLLHDDLMDRADMRRGHQTVHLKWDDNTAILSGDVMLSLAFACMAHCPEAYDRDVMETFTRTSIEIAEGQQYDMDFERRDDVTEQEYIEMIRLKTSVLLACSMKIGALLAGASAADAENLYRAGEQMGLAFQLHDDYLDVYGDPKVFGKKNGGDILCNKKTFLYVKTMQLADERQRATFAQWLAAVTDDERSRRAKIEAVTRLYTELEMPRICREEEDRYYRLAHAFLNKVSVPEERKAELRAYMADMMHRTV